MGQNPHTLAELPVVHPTSILFYKHEQCIGIFSWQLVTVPDRNTYSTCLPPRPPVFALWTAHLHKW